MAGGLRGLVQGHSASPGNVSGPVVGRPAHDYLQDYAARRLVPSGCSEVMLAPRLRVDDGNVPLVYNTDNNRKFWLGCRGYEGDEIEGAA